MISHVLIAVGLLCVQAKESIEDELNQVEKKKNGGGSQDGSQSGNYQQYMKEYAGGQGGSSGGYQQYMKKYAGGQGGDYQQYMKKYAGGSQGGSQSSNYQHYYQQYMNLNSKGSQGGYQQYMKQYAGGQGGSSGGYQKYMKQYAGKYMKDYAGSKGGSQSGDYQQYMKKYAGGQGGDYQKYMKQYAGGGQGGSQSSDSSATELLEQPAKMASELTKVEDGLHSLRNHQEPDNLDDGEQPQQKSSDDYQNYVQEYAGNEGDYQNYYSGNMNNKECSKEVGSAKDANTVHQLAKWYSEAKVNVHCYVPQEDVRYSLSDVHKQYEKRLHELDSTAESPLEELIEPLSNELVEKPQMDDKTQMAQKSAKTFLAKSETAQSEVAANLALFADQVNSDPVILVGMALLGVAFTCLVFFAVRHRQSSVRLPVGMLG